jgi:hypothetical protein
MRILKKSLVVVAFVAIGTTMSFGQKDVTEFLEIGKADAKILSEAYLRPYGEMLGRSLNGNWYNSASVHKVGGFNITLGINLVMVPDSRKSFDMNPLLAKMQGSYTLQNENNNIAPTIAGKQSARPVLEWDDDGSPVSLPMPDGTGYDKIPLPMAQVSVGLPFRTEVSLRFVPTISASESGKVNLLGFGVKHDLKEYIPFIKRLPALQSSVMVGYTKFNGEVAVSQFEGGSGQLLDINSGAFTSRLLVGVNIPFLAVYTGLGYGTATSDFDLKGDFGNEIGKDPLSLSYKTSGFDFNAGLRLRFGIIALHGDYTFGEYSMATAGIGISFR